VLFVSALELAIDYNNDGMMSSREVARILKTVFAGHISDSRLDLMGGEVLDVLCDSLQDTYDGQVSIDVVSHLVGRFDLDTRMTAFF